MALLTVSYFFQRSRIQKEKHYNEIEIKNLLLSKRRNELQQTNDHILEINNRLETRNKQLSEFNYLVSHNLRAPVTSISIIVDMMKKEGELLKSNQLLPKLDLITTSLIDFTKDIGDYASLLDEKNIKVEKVNLEKLIEQVKSEFSETLLDSTDFEVMTNLEGWTHVTFSKFYLHSIIQNLLSNAIKYRRGDVKSFIHFETIMENDEKVLLVNDNGLGINLERHGENIFKLYKRFHRNISGKGIGLFLVKSQLEALNASITLESAQKIGTKFKINFKKL
ncbi:MAG: HAMP domain-containing sensor histidine kinase [Maribacter sp.]